MIIGFFRKSYLFFHLMAKRREHLFGVVLAVGLVGVFGLAGLVVLGRFLLFLSGLHSFQIVRF